MSGAVISSNVSLKVNRAITGATTVNANCYAVVTYQLSSFLNGFGQDPITAGSPYLQDGVALTAAPLIERHFGPSQTIPTSITTVVGLIEPAGAATLQSVRGVYTISSGYELINSP